MKVSWIRALYTRAEKICSNRKLLSNQISKITKYMSWNCFPKYARNSILNRLRDTRKSNSPYNGSQENPTITIYVQLPYAGIKGEQLLKSVIHKMKQFLKQNIKFKIVYDTKKMSYFCSTKDPVPNYQRHNIVYEITCPGCNGKYIGKTDVCLETRLSQHGSQKDQPMHQHFMKCDNFIEIYRFLNNSYLTDEDGKQKYNKNDKPSKDFMINAINVNHRIIDTNRNWSKLLYLEAYYIKRLDPSLNKGLKASRELQLFV